MAYVGGFLALFVVAGFAVLVAYLSQSSETLTIPADGYWGPKELAEGWFGFVTFVTPFRIPTELWGIIILFFI